VNSTLKNVVDDITGRQLRFIFSKRSHWIGAIPTDSIFAHFNVIPAQAGILCRMTGYPAFLDTAS